MTRREAIDHAAERLREAGIDNPRREARLLLAHALSISTEDVLIGLESAVESAAYDSLLTRRAAREPLAYVLGRREFWSLEFRVSSATLVPRPESETLIEAALAVFHDPGSVRSVLDLGTGTGCLLLAALTAFPNAFGIGTDIAQAALVVARRNAADLGLEHRAAFVGACWTDALAGRFDLILSNPPYVERAEIDRLAPEVARYEPATALDGGRDGLDVYRVIVPQIRRLIGPGGAAVLELGIGQADPVTGLANAAGLTTCLRADLAGLPRALIIRNASA